VARLDILEIGGFTGRLPARVVFSAGMWP